MDPPELASEPAPCYARRGRIEPPENLGRVQKSAGFFLGQLPLPVSTSPERPLGGRISSSDEKFV
jgi:hypothetical protein